MIWKSIIGKLWATILVLVTIILLFLTILLMQFFENNNLLQVEKQMKEIGTKASGMLEKSGNKEATLSAISDIVDVYAAGGAVVTDKNFWISPGRNDLPELDRQFFTSDRELRKALKSNRPVSKQGSFPIKKNGRETHERMMIVGIPFHLHSGEHGAVFVFQSLQVIQDTMEQSQKLIYISAGIAIVLTTFFAFFLSTRIAAPLRKMRTAAIQVAHGHFDTNVPVVTRDEVGELAVTFNQMRKQLKANITALHQEKEQLSGIVNNMADGVLMLDEEGQVLTSNPPANRFLRAWRFEQEHADISAPGKLAVLADLFRQVKDSERQQIQEIGIQGRFWVVIMTPLYNPSKVRGAVAVLRDMTEEKHVDEMKKSFIANVSHELRTPIAMMQGYSEAIIDDIAQSEQEKREMARIILDESKRMGRLVNELLDLARLEAGHFQMDKKEVPLADFFRHAVNKFGNLAKEAGISLSMDINISEDVRFELDPDRIEQVMTNLIDNAIRHTKKGGSVSVGVHLTDGRVLVRIRDTGTGIAEKDLPFVFERFYKEDKARTRGKSGTGLGLAIAKHIVEAHGGEIGVNSKKGEGTTFRFSLPFTPAE
ncbi:HAMP domain-containing protein [Sporolactobacillus sp. THM7-7]|nr:HAMP domain-containing protein [Sporolactobacillus sp. THM7-7]